MKDPSIHSVGLGRSANIEGAYCVPGALIGARDTAVKKVHRIPCSWELTAHWAQIGQK